VGISESFSQSCSRLPFRIGSVVDGEFLNRNLNTRRLDDKLRAFDENLAEHGVLFEDLRHLRLSARAVDSWEKLKSMLYGESSFPILKPQYDDDQGLTGMRRQYLIERAVHAQGIESFRAITESMLGMGLMANLSDSLVRQTWSNWIDAMTSRLESTIGSSSKKSSAGYSSAIRGSRTSTKAISLISSLKLTPELLAKTACVSFIGELCSPTRGKSGIATNRGSKGSADDDAFLSQMRNWTNSDIESSVDSSITGKAPFIHLCDVVASSVLYESNYRNKSAPTTWDQEEKFFVGAELVRMILNECFIRVNKKKLSAAISPQTTTTLVIDPHRDLYSDSEPLVRDQTEMSRAVSTHVHAFRHLVEKRGFKSTGYIVMDPELAKVFASVMPSGTFFKLPPMVIPPCKWASFWRSGFMTRRLPLIRYTGVRDSSRDARVSDTSHIRECMDYLASTRWVVDKSTLDSMEKAIKLTDDPATHIDIPGIAALIDEKKLSKTITAASRGVGRRTELLQQLRDKQKQENERPILLSKIRVARDMQNAPSLYFPHSIDFRGRAYPIPAPFNHQGDDICRSLLRFGDKKPLGERGWFWLRVHAANMFGVDKVSFGDRIDWVEANMLRLISFANNPFSEESIDFVKSYTDDFWQAFSVSREVRDAIQSGDPWIFSSNLPIHQDGSCNGLQHYAALGRDTFGAKAVNIVPSDRVEDVYSVVLELVKDRIRKDAEQIGSGNHECPSSFTELKSGAGIPRLAKAALEHDVLHRKTVKQTVMTICYGVTQIGASDQVNKQLKDLPIAKKLSTAQLAVLSSYIARTILKSIDTVFTQAMEIKRWFDTVAAEMNKHEVPIAWISPAGVVCRQPYRKQQVTEIRTLVQKITITNEEEYDRAPISAAKQRLGFPPNFVHSLDASHMIMTAKACEEAGLTFAAVHDSYWTHACDVDTMNRIIREQFYKMYSEPILERLRDSLVTRLGEYGDQIPPLPAQGDLDLKCVLESPFFFD